jgi:RHS repeat-associated protein
VYKFNGKELDESTGYYYYGARYYDPAISIFLSVDPLAEQFPNYNPYTYTMNNPVNLIDPTGMAPEGREDDYKIDKDGQLDLVRKTEDKFDRILQTDSKGEIKTRGNSFLVSKEKRGTEKVAIDNISKGILRDGLNLQKKNGNFNVNGDGQPTLEEFNKFISKFSDYVGKEIAGIKLGNKDSDEVKRVLTYKYEGNTKTNSETPQSWFNKYDGFIKGHFHTHPYGDHTPSELDLQTKGNHSKLLFFIIAGGNEKKF